MKLDRNITTPKRGKYALIKLRGLFLPFKETSLGVHVEVPKEAIDYGDTDESDFFVIRLKDKFAPAALFAYAAAVRKQPKPDIEYADAVEALAVASLKIKNRRIPD